jgi:molybdopterin converting factor subunit 1
MKLTILAFGFAAEIIGQRKFELEFPENFTSEDLRVFLEKKHMGLQAIGSYALAVNQRYITDKTELRNLDEVAIIPPVSGG